MAITVYRILNDKKNKGDYLSENDLLSLIEITEKRKPKLNKKLIDIYEFIEDVKYKKNDSYKK